MCSADQQGLFRVSPYCKNMIPLPDMAPNRAAHLGYQLASSPLKLLPASPSCSVSCNAFGSIAHTRGQRRARWLMATIHIKGRLTLCLAKNTPTLNQTELTLGPVYSVALSIEPIMLHTVDFKSWNQNWAYLLSKCMFLVLLRMIHQWTLFQINKNCLFVSVNFKQNVANCSNCKATFLLPLTLLRPQNWITFANQFHSLEKKYIGS